jgi:hypothetical protein
LLHVVAEHAQDVLEHAPDERLVVNDQDTTEGT